MSQKRRKRKRNGKINGRIEYAQAISAYIKRMREMIRCQLTFEFHTPDTCSFLNTTFERIDNNFKVLDNVREFEIQISFSENV